MSFIIYSLFYDGCPQKLKGDKVVLESKLGELTNSWVMEKNRNYDLLMKLETLERDFLFKIDILGSQLNMERELTLRKTQIDVTAVNEKVKGEYDTRLIQ